MDYGRAHKAVIASVELPSPARVAAPAEPIGLHRARIVAREGLRVKLDALEAIDGTPVVDIKPASARPHDALHAAHQRRWSGSRQ